ncbi:MAG: HD domain-containing protein [Phycisphaerales bacterium]|nr:HD domain-containing protein [Phycisphaerales bacterium]
MVGLSLRARLRVLVFAASVAGAIVALSVGIPMALTALIKALEGEAELSALLWAERIDKQEFARIAADPTPTTAECAKLQADAARVLEAGAVLSVAPANAYGLVKTRSAATTGVDILFSAKPRGGRDWVAPGTPYNLIGDAGRVIPLDRNSSGVFDDQWGQWISGFVPVRAEDGTVLGLLGVDLPYRVVEEQASVLLVRASLITLVAALVAGLVADRIAVRFLAPLARMRQFVAKVGRGETQAPLPETGSPDLVGVARELNNMAEHLREREALKSTAAAFSVVARTSQARFDAVSEAGRELNEVQDADVLLERVLAIARRILNCDGGIIYLRQGAELVMATIQAESLEMRGAPSGTPLMWSGSWMKAISGGVVWHVASSGRTLLEEDAYGIGSDRPYFFDKTFDQQYQFRTRAIMAIPLRTAAGASLGVLVMFNPVVATDDGFRSFSADDLAVAEQFASLAAVGIERAQLMRGVIMRMVRMSEVHDPSETGAHVQRVASCAVAIYEGWAAKREIGSAQLNRTRDVLRLAAMVHDVGKVGIPDAILKKPGKLSSSEFARVKMHTIIGAKLFESRATPFDVAAADVALHHHERWDGAGYPGPVQLQTIPGTLDAIEGIPLPTAGLKGEEIPLFARIVCLADVFDALSSRRQYKEAWPLEKVLEEIRRSAGGHFDPELVAILLSRIEVIKELARRFQTDRPVTEETNGDRA